MAEADDTRRPPCGDDAAIIEMVAAMREALSLAGSRVELASGCLDRGQRDAALGALAGVEVDLADALALQRSILRIVRGRLGRC